MNIIHANAIKSNHYTDILIIGAGSAGCVAALSAAHSPYSVTLVERYGFAGGTSTQLLDTFYGFFTPGQNPRKIVGGWPDRVVNRLEATGDIFLRPNTYGAGTGVNYNPERLKLVWDQMLGESGVNLFYHTLLVEVQTADQHLKPIFFHKGEGFFSITCRRVIDASGDADYCHLAGLPYEKAGEHEPAQSMTTTFRMANVDLSQFQASGGNRMLKEKMALAVDTQTYALPRRYGSAHEMCQTGCISTVAVKVAGLDPGKLHELSQAEQEGRRQAFVYEDFFRAEIPGFRQAKIIGLSHQIGIRETRRVYGWHRLTKEECISAKLPSERIFLCGAPIEDHRDGAGVGDETYWEYIQGDGIYGVPYLTLVPRDSRQTWVVGRCFSATHDAHASCRSMAQTMSMGQAAGLAAVQSLQLDQDARHVDVPALQDQLLQLGAILDPPDHPADISRDGWRNNTVTS